MYAELRGDTELALTPHTVESFQCTGRESNAPDIFRYGVALTRLYTAQVCELLNWVDSVTIHYYWRWRRYRAEILNLCLGPRDRRPNLEASSSIETRAARKLSSLSTIRATSTRRKYTVSQKTSKIIFVITMSNFHQIQQFLAQRWQIV